MNACAAYARSHSRELGPAASQSMNAQRSPTIRFQGARSLWQINPSSGAAIATFHLAVSGEEKLSLASWIARTMPPTRVSSCSVRGSDSRARRPGTNSSTCRPASSISKTAGTSTPALRTAAMNAWTPAVDADHGFLTVSPTRTTAPLVLPPESNSSGIHRGYWLPKDLRSEPYLHPGSGCGIGSRALPVQDERTAPGSCPLPLHAPRH